MSLYFAATELEDWEAPVGTITEGVTATHMVAANSRKYSTPTPTITDDLNYLPCIMSAADDDIWIHAIMYPQANASTLRFLKLYGGSSVLLLGVRWNTGSVLEVAKWTGSAWSTLLTTPINKFLAATRYRFDMHVKLGNPGTISLYLDDLPVVADAALNIDFNPVVSINEMRLQSMAAVTSSVDYSEVIIADYITIGSKIQSLAPDANGNYTAWTNDFTAIDEVSGGTDTISTTVVGDRESWSVANATALAAGEAITGVGMSISAIRDASSPQNINMFTRIGATDYDAADRTLAAANTNRQKLWELSPATTAAWTVTEINAAEWGVRART